MITNPNPNTIASPPIHPWPSHLKSQFKAISQAVVEFLIARPNRELTVTELAGANGFTYWEIHDPMTEKTFYFMNKGEVLEWLDSQH